MIENSGFLNDDREFLQISSSFSDVEILGSSATNIFGQANRFGKRWFFKGIRPDSPDVAAGRQRLLKEFDIQIGLAHPGIAHIISYENIDGVGECIITEWIEGATLEEAFGKGSLSKTDRLQILSEIIDAVSYLHSQGIVHRDLKPSNIMIRKNGNSAVIIDFGLADTDSHLYQKSPAGTEGYASPRQYQAHTPFTGDDIHALGVIMQQLCPNLTSIARRCRSGGYPTANALRRAILRRDHRRKMIWRASLAALFLITVTSLIVYIISLRDSLTTVSQQLDHEKTIRINREQRQSQINELKNNLNLRLDMSFADFRKTEDLTNPDNLSLIRLIDLLTEVKKDFLEKEIPYTLTDSEMSELEYSFVTHYNTILEQWNQTLSQSSRSNSTE